MKKVVLIPAYEPDERLIGLLAELQKTGLAAVVIDDGSGPAYRDLFLRAGKYASVLSYEANRGKGGALKYGFGYLREQYPEGCVVVTADADGQHKAADICRVCRAAEEHPGALVLGCRGFTAGTPLHNKMGNKITCFVFRLVTGKKISDTQTGLRAFSSGLIPYLASVPGDRYEYEMNVLMDCAEKSTAILEVPIETVYIGGNSTSHFNPFVDSWRVYRQIVRYAAVAFSSFLLDYALFVAFLWALGGLGTEKAAAVSNILARAASAAYNYILNKRLVFRMEGHAARTAAEYVALTILVLGLNTLLLELLMLLGMNGYWAKIVAGILCTFVSFFGQQLVVFRKKDETVQ